MSKRLVLTALASATLFGASPAFAQASGMDPDRHTPQQAPSVQAPAPAQPAAAPRANDRREQQGRRGDASREPRQPQDAAQAQQRPEGRRGANNDNRHADGRRGDDRRGYDHRDRRDHRGSGYVVARPSFIYTPPPVYYSAPSVYYGSAPQGYYPYNGYSGYNGGYNQYNGYAGAPVALRAGDYLPPEFQQQQYVVQDWEWRGLSAPPYGYQWMLVGPDNYALVLASTGQIVSVVAAR
jgi:Ni/Co efflux regulator RcnB